jgi:hypothetical protein
MSVANPWIAVLPEPLISHSEEGLPVRAFSVMIGFCAKVKFNKSNADNNVNNCLFPLHDIKFLAMVSFGTLELQKNQRYLVTKVL